MERLNTSPSDDSVLEKFVDEVRPAIQKYVLGKVRNADHADEIVSKVFLAIAGTWSSFRGDCPNQAFALIVASNALKNYYSRDLQKASKQISLDDWVESYTLQHDASLVCPYRQIESADWIEDLLAEINECCSEAESGIISMYYQGESFDEISELIGMNAATVRGHFLRGRKKLLVHLLMHRPEMLGGLEAFMKAVERIDDRNPGLLTQEEKAAVLTRRGTAELLRGAMIKIVPFLDGIR